MHIDEIAGNIALKLENEQVIRKHWSYAAAFTGSWNYNEKVCKVPETELLPGELSAVTFKVGCYTVRSAQRVYKVHEPGYNPESEMPADKSELELVRKDANKICPAWYDKSHITHTVSTGFLSWQDKFRITHEISAKHRSNSKGAFVYICRAAQARNCSWFEGNENILSAKKNVFLPNGRACLFVHTVYVGSSFSVDTWYKLDPAGKVTSLTLHPFNSDVEKERFV